MTKKTSNGKPTAAKKAASKASGKTSKRKKGMAAAVAAIVLTVLLVAFVGIYAYGSQLESGKTIFPNVRVAGVDVGGLTVMAAEGEVEQAVADAYSSQSLEVRLPDQTLVFEPEQTKVALDAEEAIREALAFGRSDGPFMAVFNYLTSSSRSHDVELETALELDTVYIKELIAEAAKSGKRDAADGQAAYDEDDKTITVTKGVTGRYLDTETLYEAVYNAFQSGDFMPLEWEYVEIPCNEADLEKAHASLTTEVQDASYDEENHEIVEGSSGFDFDLDAAKAKLEAVQEGQQLTIQLEEIEPELTAEELNKQMFGTQLESRSSYYVNNANRTENLRLACEAINGTIINPGEVFSFNDTVGERTEAKGYKPATIYGGEGESVDGVGGGICQVASTIYWAALYMDLETVMRAPHMYRVTYVPEGCDATIYWDSGLDYKFRNNRENPIKIQANISGGMVNITFWGVKENDNYVELTSTVLETWNEEDVEEVDETKAPGTRELKQTAYTGAKVAVYKTVYDGSGNVLRKETINSTYDARPNIYIVGPEIVEEEPEEELPDDSETDEDPWGDLGGGDEESWP